MTQIDTLIKYILSKYNYFSFVFYLFTLLLFFSIEKQGPPPALLTGSGALIAEKKASLTVGPRGPILLQDFVYLDEMSHFTRERIPERVVHAKGAGELYAFQS